MDPVVVYALALAATLGGYVSLRARRERTQAARRDEAVKAGLTEPPSLHPVIDATRCCASGACVRACPEQALGIIGGKAQLVNPSACIGHGACRASCPTEAISLVFGTERRGIDIPEVKPDFETNVPGLFIAGELGGMGLIRKAAEQGRQAVETIARRRKGAQGEELDVVIVGAGPAGIAAGLAALDRKLRFAVIEQETGLGGSVYHYPRQKIAMTAPVNLPIVGKVRFTEVSKEKLLEFWDGVVRDTGLAISFGERLEQVERAGDGFVVRGSRRAYRARSVLLAVGRRGTPRRLGVSGEDLPKVAYRLVDAAQYEGCKALVVGGGDSALEAALDLSRQAGTEVTLAYRGEAFQRVKAANRERLEAAQRASRIRVLMRCEVDAIEPAAVVLRQEGNPLRLPNDFVLVAAGGVLPTEMLRSMGVRVATKHGTA